MMLAYSEIMQSKKRPSVVHSCFDPLSKAAAGIGGLNSKSLHWDALLAPARYYDFEGMTEHVYSSYV